MPLPRLPALSQSGAHCQLKPEINTGVESKVALVVVAACKAGAEARQYVIKLPYSDGNRPGNRDVDTPANEGSRLSRFQQG